MAVASAAELILSRNCEVCGRQACYGVADTREGVPIEGPHGVLFKVRSLEEKHYYCTLHKRRPVRRRRDGSIIGPR